MKKQETTSTVLLKHHLKALKLPTMTSECEKVSARCAKENVDHLGFLLQLCELELLDREAPVRLFRLDGRPHLAGITVPRPDLAAYRALQGGGVS